MIAIKTKCYLLTSKVSWTLILCFRRTKGKNWDECNNDDSSDDSDNSISRCREVSHMAHKKKRKVFLQKTKKLSNRCVMEDSSSEMEQKTVKRSKLISPQQYSTSNQFQENNAPLDTNNSKSDSSNFNKNISKQSKINVNCRKTFLAVKSSESDSDVPIHSDKTLPLPQKKESHMSSINNKCLSNKVKTIKHHPNIKSGNEHKKYKLNAGIKSKLQFEEHFVDDYSVISTPTRSDDESIAVEKKQEISLKHYIFEEVEKIKKMTEELKNDLEYHSDYLINKKINVVRDSKFIAHKILRIYDLTYEKLKMNRNNFVDIYKSWLDTCSKNALDENKIMLGEMNKNNTSSCSEREEDRNKRKRDFELSKNVNRSTLALEEDNELSQSNDNENNKGTQEKHDDHESDAFPVFRLNVNNRSISSNSDSSVISLIVNMNRKRSTKRLNKKSYFAGQSAGSNNETDLSDPLVDEQPLNDFETEEKSNKNLNEEDEDKDAGGGLEDSFHDLAEPSKEASHSSSSINGDLDTSISEIGNTPEKPESSSKMSLRKTLLLASSQNKTSCVDELLLDGRDVVPNEENKEPCNKEVDVDNLESRALNSLLQDNSDESENEENLLYLDSSESSPNKHSISELKKIIHEDDNGEPAPQKSNNILRTQKRLLMQTKKQNSISSDSSSDSAGGCNRKKISRLGNGDDLPPRYRRRQAFNVQKNRHYKADKKLHMECRVTLERLSQNVLENYTKALEKSKNYVAKKKFLRYPD
jgi:hypothetical protein